MVTMVTSVVLDYGKVKAKGAMCSALHSSVIMQTTYSVLNEYPVEPLIGNTDSKQCEVDVILNVIFAHL